MTQPDPWWSPETVWKAPAPVEQPTGALAWGYPVGPVGSDGPPPERQRWTFPVAILATALIAGSVGGYLGSRGAADPAPSAASLRDDGAQLPAVPVVPVRRPASSVAGIAATVLRSVVSISVTNGVEGGTGSGVVLRADGYILTNNHVVESADTGSITVSFNGASEVDLTADVVGLDPETDLAVIKVRRPTHKLTPAALGTSSDLQVGDAVLAVGSPLGLAGTVTSGIISALNRTVRVPKEDGSEGAPLFNAIQTDAAINPGNSGGALVDLSGRVIGINSAIATLGSSSTEQGGSIGVGFAIPVDEARSIAEQLIRTGKATHPAIGVSATTVGADGVGPRGAKLSEVLDGGAAKKAGLLAGDVITAVEGKPVDSVDSLITRLREFKVGDTVTVTYLRGSATRTAQLVLQDKA